jgi:RNA polymerase sigma factor (sigma-70 family)
MESDMEDADFLRRYAKERSEEAFAELVNRHAGLVYAAALRQTGDATLAEDIAQTVFVILARKAGGLSPKVYLAGWLYRPTCFAAARAVRKEMRRRQREQVVMQIQQMEESSDPNLGLAQIAPYLDEALSRLRQRDRNALLLRFFENKSLKEVGQELDLSDDAAQKCIARSLAKLRGLMAKRAGLLASGAMEDILAGGGVRTSVPAPLAAKLTAGALGRAGLSGHAQWLASQYFQRLLWLKAGAALVITLAILAVTGTVIEIKARIAQQQSSEMKVRLFGTVGLNYQFVYSEEGQTHTNAGVTPGEVRLRAGVTDVRFTVSGPGRFDCQVYWSNQLCASGSADRINSPTLFSVVMAPLPTGIMRPTGLRTRVLPPAVQ